MVRFHNTNIYDNLLDNKKNEKDNSEDNSEDNNSNKSYEDTDCESYSSYHDEYDKIEKLFIINEIKDINCVKWFNQDWKIKD